MWFTVFVLNFCDFFFFYKFLFFLLRTNIGNVRVFRFGPFVSFKPSSTGLYGDSHLVPEFFARTPPPSRFFFVHSSRHISTVNFFVSSSTAKAFAV